jgi:hypothetical protein
MEFYFVLDERGEPLPERDIEAWTRWFERADRTIARTVVTPEVTVLTTFRGVYEESDEEDTAPLLYDTRVFGGILDGEEKPYPTRSDAVAGHNTMVEWCGIGSTPDAGITEADLI